MQIYYNIVDILQNCTFGLHNFKVYPKLNQESDYLITKLKITLLIFFLYIVPFQAQNTKRVLFLGNSYTQVNNLPQMTADMAASVGKNLIFDMNAPGGYYIGQHVTNAVSLAKIEVGNWDNIVLQDQSLALAYPGYFMNGLQSSIKMDSIIKANNTCAQTMFYGTWGRKNGDTYICSPPYCEEQTVIKRDFYQMNSDIQTHYKVFADSLKSSMSPVGTVWAKIRQNHPNIELFDSDGSHPSVAGTYAAACSFYAAIFRSDPTQITFNGGLSESDAGLIRQVAKEMVFDNLLIWNIGLYDDLLDNSCQTMGIDDYAKVNWKISPNPVKDILTIHYPSEQDNDVIEIYNILGELIKRINTSPSKTIISLSEYPNGVYILKSMRTQATCKIVKQ